MTQVNMVMCLANCLLSKVHSAIADNLLLLPHGVDYCDVLIVSLMKAPTVLPYFSSLLEEGTFFLVTPKIWC